MGNDGGTIARGKDLRAVFGPGDNNAASRVEEALSSMDTVCSLTSLPLSRKEKSHAVVGDYKGFLLLKEKLLEALLAKTLALNPRFLHIKSLKDIVDLKTHFNAEGILTCPITGVQRTKHRSFCYLRPCGCVFSAKVLADVRSHLKIDEDTEDALKSECPQCGGVFTFNYDIVMVNTDENATHEAFNYRNYNYITDQLHLTHAKKERKRKRSEGETKLKTKKTKTKTGTETKTKIKTQG